MRFTNKFMAAMLVSSMAATTAFAQNNNTGEIVIQGVVPGSWELTVYDINNGYDFDLSAATIGDVARVGTIHVFTNDTDPSGAGNGVGGILYVESANAGRMINDQSIPGIAADNQQYTIDLVTNVLTVNGLTEDTVAATTRSANYEPDVTTAHDLVVPMQVGFASGGGAGTLAEATYDVNITLAGALPQASGVYSDTITFTIMDDQ